VHFTYDGELTRRKERDWFLGTTLRVVEIRSRRTPQMGDIVKVGDSVFYLYEEGFASYLVSEVAAVTATNRVVATVTPPASFSKFVRKMRRRQLIPTQFAFIAEHLRPRGRQPRASIAATARVTLRLTGRERQTWQRAAGPRPLSDWIRESCELRLQRGS